MGYCGNGVGISVCTGVAAFYQGSTTNKKIVRHRLTIQTLTLSSCGADLCRSAQTHRQNRLMNITMFCAAVEAGFTAVTDGRMSSLRHLVVKGGMQILECAAGHLSGHLSFVRGRPAPRLVCQDT